LTEERTDAHGIDVASLAVVDIAHLDLHRSERSGLLTGHSDFVVLPDDQTFSE
jgi:hypothetical protein